MSVTGTEADTIGTLNPFRYRGYYYDEESGLYYLNSRYYDAETGRFVNADRYISTGQGVLGYNMFAYCNNNPVNLFDSKGTDPISIGFLILVVAVGTAIVATVATCVNNAKSTGNAADLSFNPVKSISNTVENVKNLVTIASLQFCTTMAEAAAKKIYESKVKKQAEKLSDIASGYGVFKCDKAAEAMMNELSKNNEHGKLVTIRYSGIGKFNNIWSLSKNMVVSTNGFHCGVEYKGIVYCNIHPFGLPKEEWESDFIGIGNKIS